MASADQGSDSSRLPPEPSARVPVRETLSLDSLVLDAGTQVRVAINFKVVDDYAADLEQGDRFPPVVVFRGEGRDLLSDGFHRVHAYRKAGRSEIEADVRPGTFDDALWFALGANSGHGERLQRGDKRHAIELAYRAWPDASQRRIAEHVGCSSAHVGRVRSQLQPMLQLPDRAVGSDGRTRPATRASSDSSGVAPSPVPEPPVPLSAEEPDASRVGSVASVASRRVASPPAAEEPDPSSPLDEEPSSPVLPPIPADVESSSGASSAGASAPPLVRDRSNTLCSVLAERVKHITDGVEMVDFAALDRELLSAWISDLEEGRTGLSRLIRRLREELEDGSA